MPKGKDSQTVDKVAKTRRAIKRNSIRRIVGQGRFPLQGKCHEVTKGFAESQICSCRNRIKNYIDRKVA